jgi:hypothetical protein
MAWLVGDRGAISARTGKQALASAHGPAEVEVVADDRHGQGAFDGFKPLLDGALQLRFALHEEWVANYLLGGGGGVSGGREVCWGRGDAVRWLRTASPTPDTQLPILNIHPP